MMRRLTIAIFLVVLCAHCAFAAPQGEYRAFTFTSPLGCVGLTTEYGGISDCYDTTTGGRYIWDQAEGHYVPAPSAAALITSVCTDAQYSTGLSVSVSQCTDLNAVPLPIVTDGATPSDSASMTIDWSAQSGTGPILLTTNTTVAFSNKTFNQREVIEFQQSASLSYTVTFSDATIKWCGGTTFVMTATNSKKDEVECRFDGTDTLCCPLQDF